MQWQMKTILYSMFYFIMRKDFTNCKMLSFESGKLGYYKPKKIKNQNYVAPKQMSKILILLTRKWSESEPLSILFVSIAFCVQYSSKKLHFLSFKKTAFKNVIISCSRMQPIVRNGNCLHICINRRVIGRAKEQQEINRESIRMSIG